MKVEMHVWYTIPLTKLVEMIHFLGSTSSKSST